MFGLHAPPSMPTIYPGVPQSHCLCLPPTPSPACVGVCVCLCAGWRAPSCPKLRVSVLLRPMLRLSGGLHPGGCADCPSGASCTVTPSSLSGL